jgi:polyribonucleotide nucleotidyltransferase
MTPQIHRTEVEIGDKTLSFEMGRMANLANYSLIVRYGDTECLVTVVMSEEANKDIDFLPLTVNFEERMYSAGKIPGGFIKREGRPGEPSILAGRAIDRPIRPLFPKDLRNEVNVTVIVVSTDGENIPDVIGLNGSTCALYLSDIPFNDAVAGIRVVKHEDNYIFNPTYEQKDASKFDVLVCGTKDKILMIEANAHEVPEEEIEKAIQAAHDEIRKLCAFYEKLRSEIGLAKKEFEPPAEPPEALKAEIEKIINSKIEEFYNAEGKREREKVFKLIRDELDIYLKTYLKSLDDPDLEKSAKVQAYNYEYNSIKKIIRKNILEKGRRPDRRKPEDIRPITCEVGISPRAHGTGLFTRGETQVLGTVTLGAPGNLQVLDDIHPYDEKRYLHHYQSLPYSFGDTGPVRGPGRREIGHGALAERALHPMIPTQESFPYIIRVNSDVMSSNGSTSMGATCASTLSLMDAGVPIKRPVSGIAMGLVTDDKGKYVILNDLMGTEDFMGDLDFKVAGTSEGVTAIQMDTKIDGLTFEMIHDILMRAKDGRAFILAKMLEVIPEPRADLSPYAPRIIIININPEKIGDVIGPGGKIVRKIIEETGVEIDIEDDGRIYITSTNPEGAALAKQKIEELTQEVEVNKVYKGKVVRVETYGAFVQVLPGKDGLLHVSQMSEERVGRVSDVVKLGQEIMVKVLSVDELGRIDLTAVGIVDDKGRKIDLLADAEISEYKQSSGYNRSRPDNDDRRNSGSRPPRRDSRPDGGSRDRKDRYPRRDNKPDRD